MFGKTRVSKTFMNEKGWREGGSFKIILRIFFVSQRSNCPQETLLVCQYFCVSKTSMLKRVSSRFLSQTFCVMVSKDIVGEPFWAIVQKISGSGKVYRQEWREGRNFKIFRRKLFLSQCRKILQRNP